MFRIEDILDEVAILQVKVSALEALFLNDQSLRDRYIEMVEEAIAAYRREQGRGRSSDARNPQFRNDGGDRVV